MVPKQKREKKTNLYKKELQLLDILPLVVILFLIKGRNHIWKWLFYNQISWTKKTMKQILEEELEKQMLLHVVL